MSAISSFLQHLILILDSLRPSQEGTLTDISPELLQLLLSLLAYGKHIHFNLTDSIYSKFTSKLCRDFPRDHVPLILTPLLYLEESEISTESILSNSQNIFKSSIMDTSWSKMIIEIGYSFTSSVDECKSHLMKGGGRDVTAQDVAKIISLMCQTHANLSDSSINLPTPNAFWPNSSQANDPSASGGSSQTKEKLTTIDNSSWKPDVFIHALKEIVPNLNWKEVCLGLDHPEFVIKDRAGLNLLITTIRLGMQTSGMGQNFPAECIYRHWTNVEGQLSLIAAILKSLDIYSFADHIYSSVPVEVLKTPPEPDNKEVAAWKSIHLVEVLLYISENGYYNQVLEILKFPLTARHSLHGAASDQRSNAHAPAGAVHQPRADLSQQPSQLGADFASRVELCELWRRAEKHHHDVDERLVFAR